MHLKPVLLVQMQQQLSSSVDNRIAKLETEIGRQVDRKLEKDVLPSIETRVAASSRGWIWPFIGMFIVIVVVSAVAVQKYRHLMKSHLL
jgi:hypothetical protein